MNDAPKWDPPQSVWLHEKREGGGYKTGYTSQYWTTTADNDPQAVEYRRSDTEPFIPNQTWTPETVRQVIARATKLIEFIEGRDGADGQVSLPIPDAVIMRDEARAAGELRAKLSTELEHVSALVATSVDQQTKLATALRERADEVQNRKCWQTMREQAIAERDGALAQLAAAIGLLKHLRPRVIHDEDENRIDAILKDYPQ